MSKILQGKVISNKMQNTVVVEVLRSIPHPMYKKLLRKSKKYKVETHGQKTEIGETVKIVEVSPISKDKHFALFESDKKQVISDKRQGTGDKKKETGEKRQETSDKGQEKSRVKRGGQAKKEKKV